MKQVLEKKYNKLWHMRGAGVRDRSLTCPRASRSLQHSHSPRRRCDSLFAVRCRGRGPAGAGLAPFGPEKPRFQRGVEGVGRGAAEDTKRFVSPWGPRPHPVRAAAVPAAQGPTPLPAAPRPPAVTQHRAPAGARPAPPPPALPHRRRRDANGVVKI